MPATDLHLESEQTATQGLHDYQIAAHAAAEADRPGVPLPSLELCSDLPREWPMARLCVSNKQVKLYARTILRRRAAERALHGDYYGDIPGAVNHAYIADILRISEAFAAPLANLFESCPFIPSKQLALYANLRFWQYRLLAFIAGCCKFNNQHRRQAAATTKTALSKQEKSCERDVDALSFTQTVVMSSLRKLSSCLSLGEWSSENKHCRRTTSLSIYQSSSCQPWSWPLTNKASGKQVWRAALATGPGRMGQRTTHC